MRQASWQIATSKRKIKEKKKGKRLRRSTCSCIYSTVSLGSPKLYRFRYAERSSRRAARRRAERTSERASERNGERERERECACVRVRDFRASEASLLPSIRGNLAKGIENVRSLAKEIAASTRQRWRRRKKEKSGERARLSESESVPGKRNRVDS